MSWTVRENKNLDEKIYHTTHKSGLEVFFIPKKHSASYAAMATKFGAVDREFIDAEGNRIQLTDGIAHFLEHKMFENEDGRDAFEDYARFGGNANAYTSEDKTVYLFSATSCFYENLRVLVNMVTHPYFTEQTVAKEQGIIGQEIRMYDDEPNWRLFFNTMDCLYKVDPVKLNVAGTAESISKITADTLYKIHSLFYNLRNMVLCISGNADPDEILKVLDEELKEAPAFNSKSIMPEEPAELNMKFKKDQLEVSMPLYEIAYKVDPSGVKDIRDYIAMELAFSIMFDKSSEFWNKCFAEGIFNSLNANFQTVRDNTAFAEISGVSADPEAVLDAVKEEIDRRRESGFTDEEFESAKKVLYADGVTIFESTDSIANSFINYYFEGTDLLTYPEQIASVDKEKAEKLFKQLISNDRCCLSVIEPIRQL